MTAGRRIGLAVVGAAALLGLAALATWAWGERRLARELAAIEAAGAPVDLADLARGGADAGDAAWFRALAERPEPARHDPDPLYEGFLREDLAAAPPGPRRRALQAVAECLEERAWADLFRTLEAKLRLHPDVDPRLDECERALLRANARSHRGWREAASDAERRELPPLPLEPWSAEGRRDPFGEQLSVTVNAVAALTYGALDDAVEGSGRAAVAAVTDALAASGWLEGVPHPSAFEGRLLTLSLALHGLRGVLPRLPPGLELEPAAARLAAIDLRAEHRASLLAARAHGNTAFAALRAELGAGPASWLHRLRLTFDQLIFLEHGEQALAWVERPYPEVREELAAWRAEAEASHPSWALASAMLARDPAADFAYAARAEAELLVTRGVLVAHRRGVDAARAWAAERRDPFDGRPLRARVRADGTLVLWSVGANGVDEGGRSALDPDVEEPDDVAARYRALR